MDGNFYKEVPSRQDSVNDIADIEEAVPNDSEEKNIDKQRYLIWYLCVKYVRKTLRW